MDFRALFSGLLVGFILVGSVAAADEPWVEHFFGQGVESSTDPALAKRASCRAAKANARETALAQCKSVPGGGWMEKNRGPCVCEQNEVGGNHTAICKVQLDITCGTGEQLAAAQAARRAAKANKVKGKGKGGKGKGGKRKGPAHGGPLPASGTPPRPNAANPPPPPVTVSHKAVTLHRGTFVELPQQNGTLGGKLQAWLKLTDYNVVVKGVNNTTEDLYLSGQFSGRFGQHDTLENKTLRLLVPAGETRSEVGVTSTSGLGKINSWEFTGVRWSR